MTFTIDPELELGLPLRCGPMTLFPVLRRSSPAPRAYVSGPEAAGAVTIHEHRGGVVGELVARNRSGTPVLLIEGDTVLGTKQDRVLNVSVLLAAHRATTLPVSCVEAGRWGRPTPSRRSARHAPPSLRARKTRSVIASARLGRERSSDQRAVWDEVARYQHRAATRSPSAAMRDVQDALAPRVSALVPDGRPDPRQVGVVVASGGRPTLLELFDDPVTFDAYWHSLIEGYALDAALAGGEDDTSVDQAAALLDAARTAPFESRPGVSLGDDVHAQTGELTATGIGWGGALLHLVCFATA